jgi:hypothetical protein
MGVEGYLLVSKLIVVLSRPSFSVDLPSVGSCLLFLLVSLLLYRLGLHSWLGGSGVVVMGSVGVTTLHLRGSGDPKLPRAPEVALSSSEVSSRVVCRDGVPLCTIPMNMALESPS